MNAMIDYLNAAGARGCGAVVSIFLQSSLVIALLWLGDLALRHRARASVRYALGCLILVKLVLPPGLSSPTSLAYWWPGNKAGGAVKSAVTIPAPALVSAPSASVNVGRVPAIPAPVVWHSLSGSGWVLLLGLAGALGLGGWLLVRIRFVKRLVSEASEVPEPLASLAGDCARRMSVKQPVGIRLSSHVCSPAVCGLVRPVILLPVRLAETLSKNQLEAVFLHEMAHIRRHDAWVNTAQTLLQIVYWWHPLVWLANAHLRRLREQAVDEQVMVTLCSDAAVYPATLIEVAKSALRRPQLALGLIGILESRSALKQRIEMLMTNTIPSNTRLGWGNIASLVLAGLVLLPMARAENQSAQPVPAASLKDEDALHVSLDIQLIQLPRGSITNFGLGEPNVDSNGTNWILTPQNKRVFQELVKHFDGPRTERKMAMSTVSGRQCRLGSQSAQTVVTGVDTNRISTDDKTGSPQVSFTTEDMMIGTLFDLHPSVIENGNLIHLDVKMSMNAFMGYDEPKPKITSIVVNGRKLEYTQPLPHILKLAIGSVGNIPSGGALLLGAETDVPWQTESKPAPAAEPYQLLVVLSPTVTSPAGIPIVPGHAAAMTAYSPRGQKEWPANYPVITADIVDGNVGAGEFTVDRAVGILKSVAGTDRQFQSVGFSKTFIDKYGVKGVTLFRAASITLSGRGDVVAGIVEPRDFSKPYKADRRVFHVNARVFSENLAEFANRLTLPKAVTPLEALEYQMRFGGIDISRPGMLTYDAASGSVTLSATPEDLDRAEVVLLDLNQAKSDLAIYGPSVKASAVLFEARIMKMTEKAFAGLNLGKPVADDRHTGNTWAVGPESWNELVENVEKLPSVVLLSRPRVMTSIGVPASMWVGDTNSSVALDIAAMLKGSDVVGIIAVKTTGQFGAPGVSDWPHLDDMKKMTETARSLSKNVGLCGEVLIPSQGGLVLSVQQDGANSTNTLAVFLTAKKI
jgi:beta-lactamase regulating signal transducer with metallopeptidase domain